MPHDYQFWQKQRRTSTAQYRFFSTTFAVPSQAGLRGSVTVTAPGPRRAANSAYWLQRISDATTEVVVDPLPEELRKPIIPDRAPGPQRTSNDQYWRNNAPQIGDEIHGMRISEITSHARGFSRASNDQYWHDNKPQIADEVIGMPVWNIPDRALGAARAAPSIYWRDNQVQIGDEVIGMPVWNIPDRALGARRAADYLINLKPAIDDEVVGMRVIEMPDIARGAIRTANNAYRVNTSFVVDDAILDLEELRKISITDFARGPQRTANSAYWYDNTQAAIIETAIAYFPEVRQAITERADGFSRAANPHYWIANWQIPTDVIVSGGRGFVSTFARGAARADRTAYDQPTKSVTIDDVVVPDFEEIRRVLFPDRAPGKQRQANTAYWHDIPLQIPDGALFVCLDSFNMPLRAAATAYLQNSRFVVPDVTLDEEAIHRRLIPSRATAKNRAPNTVYWRDNRFQIGDEIEGMLIKAITDMAPGPRRAANMVYFVNVRFADETVPFSSEVSQAITERAPGTRRAANTAYWSWLGQGTVIIDNAAIGTLRPMKTKNWHRNR